MLIKPYYEEPGITIYNADCRDVLPQLEPVDLVLTDPPYGEDQAIWDGDKPPEVIWDFFYHSLKEGGRLFYFGFWGHADWVLTNAKRVGLIPQSRIIWWFRTGRPEKLSFREDTEESWYFSKGEPSTFNPDEDLEPYEDEANYARYGRKGKHPGTVWIASRIFHNHPENFGHETQKPKTLLEKMIRISSNQGQTILDPFMGSGTTLRACKDLGRKAIGIEICEAYCKIAVERLKQGCLDLSTGSGSRGALIHEKSFPSSDGISGKEQLGLIDGEHRKRS